jgi:hypothetical protein
MEGGRKTPRAVAYAGGVEFATREAGRGLLLMERRLFGAAIKYPLYRLAHFPEWVLRRRLYLDFSGETPAPCQVPDFVRVPDHSLGPALPELTVPLIDNTRLRAQLLTED